MGMRKDGTSNLRHCLVDKGRTHALFHCWNHWSCVLEPSLLVGGHPGGCVSGTRAVVELDDGTMKLCDILDVRFTDRGGKRE